MVELERLLAVLGGTCELQPASCDVRGVSLDSRSVGAGELYAALPGRAADGALFVGEAVARGAVAILSPAPLPTPLPGGVPNWVHERARAVCGEAAALVAGHPSRGMFTVAVTGTNGKTSVAHLVAHLLETVGRAPALLGTAGNRLAGGVRLAATHTTPDAPALQQLLARHRELGGDSVALEASSHALDQERLAGLEVDVAVLTNVSRDHLDYHGDMEHYAAAKQRLFSNLAPGTHAVLNADDPTHARMAAAARARGAIVHTFSTRSRADLRASRLQIDARGTRFFIHGMGISRTWVGIPLVGRFNVENALAALLAVLLSGASPSRCLEGLATVIPVPGRLEPVPTGDRGFALVVDYAHTPDALARVLETLRETLREGTVDGRLICVFGCGGDRDPGKRAPMGRIAAELADLTFVCNDNPRSEDPAAIAAAVLAGADEVEGADVRLELDRRRAIAAAVAAARPGDVVLIAGKGHETVQVLGGRELEFSDQRVAREVLERTAES